ncbi:Nucleoside 2-deoxyribosyltransferase [uncultured Caudovirales phage]|uniref:Nucleoside 2-deoxyribosyltransferase n=1 Tax=uncultured Caudovirales phage TaxID=2100421 RepID=A0A6J5SKQ8_9CAUD|nr:Nucleoside 2-deoxyribosyltransferase [uncultured Caudovirales phage]CAB4219654.1 Nucleoside 2-deoxyribosyltransferase [uncultured Caudovirales phage]
MKTVYLAGPIDFADATSPAAALKQEAKNYLLKEGYWVFDPAEAWSAKQAAEQTPIVQDINMDAIDKCDLVVAILVRGVLSIGTVLEIHHASGMFPKKPTYIIGNIGKNSAALAYLGVEVYNSITETGL